ncbi:MAG: endonuclease/exonuclease/phosphatase family protein [Bacteroidetes bacterium]|nr:endonuclease/exonuclease/phosphatase family protein [Bacteroidota bacterium]
MLRGFFKILNILALLVLLASCLAAYINPAKHWQFAFIGFAFPVVLVMNFFFLVLWIAKRDRFGLLPLFAIVLSWSFIQSTFAMNFKEDSKEEGIKLMSWNVKSFDLYNWSHNKETRTTMLALIEKEQPDVLCMQEFYTNNLFFHNLEYFRDTLGYPYYYFPPNVDLYKFYKTKAPKNNWKTDLLNQQWGVAIFSKFPIGEKGKIDFDNSLSNGGIYADIQIKGQTLRLFNVHFQSIHLGQDDYATLDSLETKQQTNLQGIKSIVRKMKRAYTRRSIQVNAVKEHLDEFNGLKILCGDFNDVPVSYTYKTAEEGLNDAFIEKGKGFGATYAHRLSIFRIDYHLYSPSIKINSYRTITKPLSDHYPVVTTFSL